MDEGIGVTAENNGMEFVSDASSDLVSALNNGAMKGYHVQIYLQGEVSCGRLQVRKGFSANVTKIAMRKEFAGKNIVVVFPNTGLRYLGTNYLRGSN